MLIDHNCPFQLKDVLKGEKRVMFEEVLGSYSEDVGMEVDPDWFETVGTAWGTLLPYKTIAYRLFLDYMLASAHLAQL